VFEKLTIFLLHKTAYAPNIFYQPKNYGGKHVQH
jgi:hypothetical protein